MEMAQGSSSTVEILAKWRQMEPFGAWSNLLSKWCRNPALVQTKWRGLKEPARSDLRSSAPSFITSKSEACMPTGESPLGDAWTSSKQVSQTRCTAWPKPKDGARIAWRLEHLSQNTCPHLRQWCLRRMRLKVKEQRLHCRTAPSGIQTPRVPTASIGVASPGVPAGPRSSSWISAVMRKAGQSSSGFTLSTRSHSSSAFASALTRRERRDSARERRTPFVAWRRAESMSLRSLTSRRSPDPCAASTVSSVFAAA
mmetsp:Transcript_47154/g.112381  ORF Transcript_47154/g.112381 Transcript_47154/m.112381 type:complete len:255 (-) Transcript_47154:916-1680(-)